MAGTTLFPSLITAATRNRSYSKALRKKKKKSCLIYEEKYLRWQDFISLMYIHMCNIQENKVLFEAFLFCIVSRMYVKN